ncbi:MAG: hypothetical protein ACE5KR_02265 [Candidatus Bipolaricaulia bacterium]
MTRRGKSREDRTALSSFYLRGTLEQEGCSICRLLREGEERWLWHLIYELTGDPGVRAKLDRSFGLCQEHAYLLIEIVEERELISGDGVARIYETVVADYLRRLREAATELARGRHKAREALQGVECPLCTLNREMERIKIHTLLEALEEGEWLSEYRRSAGLCNRHLLLALEESRDRELGEFLLEDHLGRLERLVHGLQELQRKQRYDVDDKVTPEEARSWREAIWRFTGMKYDRPLIRWR